MLPAASREHFGHCRDSPSTLAGGETIPKIATAAAGGRAPEGGGGVCGGTCARRRVAGRDHPHPSARDRLCEAILERGDRFVRGEPRDLGGLVLEPHPPAHIEGEIGRCRLDLVDLRL